MSVFRITPEFLERVASVALDAPSTMSYTKAVMDHFGVHRTKADSWVRRAREAGYDLPYRTARYLTPKPVPVPLRCWCGDCGHSEPGDGAGASRMDEHCRGSHGRRIKDDERTPREAA